jgi:hypothetical protein
LSEDIRVLINLFRRKRKARHRAGGMVIQQPVLVRIKQKPLDGVGREKEKFPVVKSNQIGPG